MRTTRALGAIAAGSLLFAACGGSATDSATESDAAPAPTPAVAEQATDEPATTPATASATAPAVEPATEPTRAPATAVAEPVEVAPAALQFSAPLVGGGELDASTLAGKPTVFWFWAPT